MQKRKELKRKAKEVIKKNYWTAIVVCFLLALITGEFGNSITGIWQSEDTMNPNYVLLNEEILKNTNLDLEIFKEQKNEIKFDIDSIKEELTNTEKQIVNTIDATLNSSTKTHKYMFKIWDATRYFMLNLNKDGVILCIVAILSVLFVILLAEPLRVGGKRYFIKARKDPETKASEMIKIFNKKDYKNIVTIMFLKNMYNILWCITIIGGFIKYYEYRMIPYILAENPNISRKKAFKLSKQMMRHNKWKVFVLDISFFLWHLLSAVTLGILSILYLNPYIAATLAEVYTDLKEKIISNKEEYYEELKI